MTSPRVLIRVLPEGQWSPVGHAAIEVDPVSGMTLLRLELSAMAPKLYVSLEDLLILANTPTPSPSPEKAEN